MTVGRAINCTSLCNTAVSPTVKPLVFANFLAPNMTSVYADVAERVGEALEVPAQLIEGSRFEQLRDGSVGVAFLCASLRPPLRRAARHAATTGGSRTRRGTLRGPPGVLLRRHRRTRQPVSFVRRPPRAQLGLQRSRLLLGLPPGPPPPLTGGRNGVVLRARDIYRPAPGVDPTGRRRRGRCGSDRLPRPRRRALAKSRARQSAPGDCELWSLDHPPGCGHDRRSGNAPGSHRRRAL